MIDDYTYDNNAFGSDNDDDASIQTNNSGINENTKAEDSTKANAKNEAVRTNATNNRSNNNQDTTLIEGSGRVEEQQGDASRDSLDGEMIHSKVTSKFAISTTSNKDKIKN